MPRNRLVLPLLAICLVLASCAQKAPETLYDVEQQQVMASNALGFDLIAELADQDASANVFVSPVSVHMALAMTYNGAVNSTAEAMAKTLHILGMSLEELNAANAGLSQSLAQAIDGDKALNGSVANSIWAREGVSFYEDFMERNERYYGAEVGVLDFGEDKAARTINRWVDRETNGKIEEIVEAPINPMTVMFLINAVYFQGDWQTPFDAKQTETRPFYLANGQQQQVPLMSLRHTLPYAEDDAWQMVSLPYGENGRLSMVVLLPKEGYSVATLMSSLDAETWQEMVEGLEETKGFVALPRFTVEYEATLNEPLKTLGMEVAFDPDHADFGKLRPIPPNVYISEVKHKTFIEVNEEGTEAAAATSVELTLKSALVETFNMVADHPFIYGIQDSETGTLLFLGVMNAPE